MPNYLWTAKDPSGRAVTEQVTAANASEAKAQLVARGYTELVLKTDEVHEISRELVHNQLGPPPTLTPAQQARYQESKWAPIRDALRQSKGTLLLCAALLAWGLWRGRIGVIILGGGGLLVFPALLIWFGLPSRYYAKLNQAKVAHRWEEVLHLVERLRTIQRWTKFGPGEIELARNRAHALAGLGRMDQAVSEFMRFENHPKLPRWLFLSHLAGICDTGKAHDKSTALAAQAAAEKSDSATVWIDLAYRLARFKKDAAGAREALAKAEAREVVAMGKPWLPWVRGLIAVAENDFPKASQQFDESLAGLAAFQRHELIRGMIYLEKSYLCWMKGTLGNTAEAQQLFAEVEDWLISGREEELLAHCRHSLGRA